MALQNETLHEEDANGRLVRMRMPDPADQAAPLFFWGRTPIGSLWRFHQALPEPALREIARLAGAEAPADAIDERLPERLAPIRRHLEAVRTPLAIWHGPAFHFPVSWPDPGPAERVGPDGHAEVAAAFPELASTLAASEPIAIVRCDGAPVAICRSATTAPSAAVEAGVETLPAHRGRGFATRAVSAWARAIRSAGRIPLYSTSWENRGSRGIARRLGLIPYGTDLHLR